ncbi:hypothetical protein ABK040_004304 [Willaertia magna]
MKRNEKIDDTSIASKKTKRGKTLFSLLPTEIINHILDYSSFEIDNDLHPFALVSKTTRNCWLNHYLSLPFKLRTNLIEFGDSINYDLDYKLSFLDHLKQIIKTTKAPIKKENKRLAQLDDDKINRIKIIDRLKQFNLTDIELKEMENIINNHCFNIIITVYHHYDRDTFCYYLYTVKFDIHGINFSSTFSKDADRYGPGGDLTIPKNKSKDWNKIINLCKCNLTKERLYDIIFELLEIYEDTFEYEAQY